MTSYPVSRTSIRFRSIARK